MDKQDSRNLRIETIDKVIKNNLIELQHIRKREYPLCLKWYPEIFKEMYNFYKYKKLPIERFKNTTNASLYISRFKELAIKSFYLNGDRLFFIKKNETNRLSDGEFEDIQKVLLKKIPYVYEILPKIEELHSIYGHISYKTLAKHFLETEYYFNGIEIITEEYCKQCGECNAKFFSKKLIKSPKIILDEGPHFRLLVDITYLDNNFYQGKTKYKYIIDSIDHFSKFYLAFLITEKLPKQLYKK